MPPEIQGRFRGRKDGTTQNVLNAISFDLKFTYVLAGWKGNAHDSRVLNDAFARLEGFWNFVYFCNYEDFVYFLNH